MLILAVSQLRQRDIETEEVLGEMQHKIQELEKQNTSLKNKVDFINVKMHGIPDPLGSCRALMVALSPSCLIPECDTEGTGGGLREKTYSI